MPALPALKAVNVKTTSQWLAAATSLCWLVGPSLHLHEHIYQTQAIQYKAERVGRQASCIMRKKVTQRIAEGANQPWHVPAP